jgi:hypothetical protein
MSNILNPRTTTYASFLDLDILKQWLMIDADDTTYDFQLQLLGDSISTRCQRFIGGPIAPQVYGPADGIGKFDGGGGPYQAYIMLPRVPVLQVTSVIEYQGENPVTLTEITTPGQNSTDDGYVVNYRLGRIERVLGSIWPRPWMAGSQNIWITWLAGYNPIPSDLYEACLEWAAERFHDKFQARQSGPMSASDMHGGDDGEEAAYKGMPYYVKQVLSSGYLRPSIGG